MAYQKIINLLVNTLSQPSKFNVRRWFEINYESHGVYNSFKFKTSMLRSILCGHADAHILVTGTITVSNMEAKGADPDNRNKNGNKRRFIY